MSAKKKPHRRRFEVVPIRGGGWDITCDGHWITGGSWTKREAIAWARDWAEERQPSELVIKGRDGRIKDTRSYGADPRRTRG